MEGTGGQYRAINQESVDERHRYCGGRISFKWLMAMACGFCLIATLIVVLIIIFVVGKNIAQGQLNDAAITMRMTVGASTATQFDSHLQGSIDNRGTIGATLKATTVYLSHANTQFAYLAFPEIDAAGGSETQLDVQTTVYITDKAGFDKFSLDLLNSQTVLVSMTADVDVVALGITYKGLHLNKDILLNGIAGLQQLKVLQLTPNEGLTDRLVIAMVAQITNPSDVSFSDIGQLNLTLFYKNTFIGYSVANSRVGMPFGTFLVNETTYLVRNGKNEEILQEVLGAYNTGRTITVQLRGNPHTTDVALLQNTLAQLNTPAQLPGLVHWEDKIFSYVFQTLNPIAIPGSNDPDHCGYVPKGPSDVWSYTDAYIFTHNPLGVTMTLTSANFTVWWDGDPTTDPPFEKATYASGVSNTTATIPPFGTVVYYQRLCITNYTTLGSILQWFPTQHPDINGVIPFLVKVSVAGVAGGNAGNFTNVMIPYHQEDIPVVSRLSFSSPTDKVPPPPTAEEARAMIEEARQKLQGRAYAVLSPKEQKPQSNAAAQEQPEQAAAQEPRRSAERSEL